MKLIRYGQPGAERPGLVDATGTLRDLSMLLPDIGPAQLNPRTLSALAAIDASRLPAVYGSPRLGSPVGAVGKIVCVGLNYADHAKEAGMQPPAEPVLFMKAVTALSGPNDDVRIPPGATKTDWEVEPGDLILTGTPAGVGLGQKPAPWFLKPGDVVRLGATGLGEQLQKYIGG